MAADLQNILGGGEQTVRAAGSRDTAQTIHTRCLTTGAPHSQLTSSGPYRRICCCGRLLLLLLLLPFPAASFAFLHSPAAAMPFYRDGKAYPSQQPQESQDAPESSQLAPATQLERPPDCRNFNETPAFGILCSTMDRLRNEKPTKRIDTLTRFLQLWRIKVGNDFYPVIRLLLPDVSRACRIHTHPSVTASAQCTV